MPTRFPFLPFFQSLAPARYRRQRGVRKRQPLRSVETLEARQMLAAAALLNITIDYRFDTNNFFNTQEKRDRLQEAADMIASHLGDDLAAIVPGGMSGGITNRWTATFFHPGLGSETTFPDLTIGANEIIVFAGGRNLGGSLRGLGGRGGFTVNGTNEFVQLVENRGELGTTSGANANEYAPWGGAISFTNSSSVDWYFGESTAGLTSGKTDFLSVALHEMMHVFGYGTADSWEALVDGASRRFEGAAATAAYDGAGNPPLSSDLTHWTENLADDGFETAMDPTLTQGQRKLLTGLDIAALDDIGWELIAPEANTQINFRVVASATPTSSLGEVVQLPAGVARTDEWEPLLVEVWLNTPDDNSAGIREASLKLFTNPGYYRVSDIQPGPAFATDFDSEIQTSTGRTTLDGFAQLGSAVGASGHVLLARVLLEPTPTGPGVPLDFSNLHPAEPAPQGWISLDASTSTAHLTSGNEANVTAGTPIAPKLWPVIYDLNDDGRIGFADLSIFSAAFLTDATTNVQSAKADFDQSGRVGFGDISWLSANFLTNRGSGTPLSFPGAITAGFAPLTAPPETASAPLPLPAALKGADAEQNAAWQSAWLIDGILTRTAKSAVENSQQQRIANRPPQQRTMDPVAELPTQRADGIATESMGIGSHFDRRLSGKPALQRTIDAAFAELSIDARRII